MSIFTTRAISFLFTNLAISRDDLQTELGTGTRYGDLTPSSPFRGAELPTKVEIAGAGRGDSRLVLDRLRQGPHRLVHQSHVIGARRFGVFLPLSELDRILDDHAATLIAAFIELRERFR